MKILLASSSPRRRDLLLALGHKVVVEAPNVEEITSTKDLDPQALSLANARLKACAIKSLGHEDIIVGADTIVRCDNDIFFKPKDQHDAYNMLQKLSHRQHEVITSYYLIARSGKTHSRSVSSTVEFRALSQCEITSYLEANEWVDKAGAYGVQGIGAALIRQVIGSITNVIGLPIEEFLIDAEALIQSK